MRISTATMTALPLPAAWLEGDTFVARTPEWTSPTWGMRAYRAGHRLRLLVAPLSLEPGIAALCDRVLLELHSAVPETPPQRRAALRLALGALRVIAGHGDVEPLSEAGIAEAVVFGCAMETRPPRVGVAAVGEGQVGGGWLVAAALKQLAINAARHEGCDAVALRLGERRYSVGWSAPAGRSGHQLTTSRHREQRSGWGLGMVRLACDALGATHLAPYEVAIGDVETAIAVEPESSCLRLPLALVDADDVVVQATRTWDIEAGVSPGRRVSGTELGESVAGARRNSGRIVRAGPWVARCEAMQTWVALRPADTREQGLDLLEGLVHEAELLVGEPESNAWRRAVGAIEALQLALGQPQLGWASSAFLRDLVRYGAAYGVDLSSIRGVATPAPSPALSAFVLAVGGGGVVTPVEGGWSINVRTPEATELASLVLPDGSVRVRVADLTSLQEVG